MSASQSDSVDPVSVGFRPYLARRGSGGGVHTRLKVTEAVSARVRRSDEAEPPVRLKLFAEKEDAELR